MILRFESPARFLNISTGTEEYSEGMVAGRKYIKVSESDLSSILENLDFNCYNYRPALDNDVVLHLQLM